MYIIFRYTHNMKLTLQMHHPLDRCIVFWSTRQVQMWTGSVVYVLMVVLLRRSRGAIREWFEVSETRCYSNEHTHISPCYFGIYTATFSSDGGGSLTVKDEVDLSIRRQCCYKGGQKAAKRMWVKHIMLFLFNQRTSHLLTSAFAGRDYDQETDEVSWQLEWV